MAGEVAAGAVEGGLSESTVSRLPDHDAVISDLRRTLQEGDFILIKGSRGMHMELVAQGIRNLFVPQPGKKEVA